MIPPELRKLAEALAADAELALVGGAVRDELLGRPHGDWDLATALRPETVLARARAAGFRAVPTGLQHGTVTVILAEGPVEITTFRSDGDYRDGRRPVSVRLGVSLEEDLARRDFTINAMAVPLAGGGLVDPHGGRADLREGLIRAVGDPLQRFSEDGLRPLRACRFAAQLGFRIEPATLAAIPERLDVARRVAPERVLAELTKLLTGAHPRAGLEALRTSGLLDLWLPELAPMVGCAQNRHHRWDVWEHTLEVAGRVQEEPGLRWAALLHDAGKPGSRMEAAGEVHFHGHESRSGEIAEAILRRLRASNHLKQEVLALVRHHGTHPEPAWSDAACRRFLRRLGEDALPLERWAAFRLADQRAKGIEDPDRETRHGAVVARLAALAAQRPPLSVRDLALDGSALMAMAGRKGGPWLGALQAELLEAVVEDPGRNTPEGLAALAAARLARSGPPPGPRDPRPGR